MKKESPSYLLIKVKIKITNNRMLITINIRILQFRPLMEIKKCLKSIDKDPFVFQNMNPKEDKMLSKDQ